MLGQSAHAPPMRSSSAHCLTQSLSTSPKATAANAGPETLRRRERQEEDYRASKLLTHTSRAGPIHTRTPKALDTPLIVLHINFHMKRKFSTNHQATPPTDCPHYTATSFSPEFHNITTSYRRTRPELGHYAPGPHMCSRFRHIVSLYPSYGKYTHSSGFNAATPR